MGDVGNEVVFDGECRRAVRRGEEEGDFSTTGVENVVETEADVEMTVGESSSVWSCSVVSVTRGESAQSSEPDWSDW